jgi:hypothetical protein
MRRLLDAERALKFAFLITQRLGKNENDRNELDSLYIVEKFNFIARVSTGVSTGQTFCVSIRIREFETTKKDF